MFYVGLLLGPALASKIYPGLGSHLVSDNAELDQNGDHMWWVLESLPGVGLLAPQERWCLALAAPWDVEW